MIRPQEVLGVILVENSEATVAKVEGKSVEVLGNYTSGVPGKSSKGGQSARRFERLRDMVLNDFYTRVGDHANDAFLAIPKLTKIIVGGPGNTKNEFLRGNYLNYQLRDKIVAIVDTAYTEEQGVKEALEKAAEKLERIELVEERRIVQRFLSEVSKDSGLAIYGEKEVGRALESHKVATLLLSEDFDDVVVRVSCSSCGHVEERRVKEPELELATAAVKSERCPKCTNFTLAAEPLYRLFDEFSKKAEESQAEVQVISSKTEEGTMLLRGFGGVAALLKH
jgi:peptide chain release factor subunit 1